MSAVERPYSLTYANSDAFEFEKILTVYCERCNERIGVVGQTPYGPLWLGLLHNRGNRRSRVEVFGAAFERNWMPQWLVADRAYYNGECRCLRNAAVGAPVWEAWLAQSRSVVVPSQE